MKKVWVNLLGHLKKVKAREWVLLVFIATVISFGTFHPKTVNVIVTYEENNGLEGENAILYIDSGNGWNDIEAYESIIEKDNRCILQIKSYEEDFLVRLDPVAIEKKVEISGIEIQRWGRSIAFWEGKKLQEVIEGSINIESINVESNVLKIVPMNYDPEIYMSLQFCNILAYAMRSDRIIKLVMLLALGILFCGRLYIKELFFGFAKRFGVDSETIGVNQFIQRVKRYYGIGVITVIVAILGIILIELSSINIMVIYANREDLQYSSSIVYIDRGEGWTEAQIGGIKKDGSVKLKIGKHSDIKRVRIDPVSSPQTIKIEKITIRAFGRILFEYKGKDLIQIIDKYVNVEEHIDNGEALEIYPVNEDPQIILGTEFCEDLVSVVKADRIWKQVILGLVLIVVYISGCWVQKQTWDYKKIQKRGMVFGGIAVGIITVFILFEDFLGGDYQFTYTNIIYPIMPFKNLGVAVKGLGASDMADAEFPAIWHLYENGQINSWLKYNLFGYEDNVGRYVLSPFMWLCYGITSGGQFIRYLLKNVLAFAGMYLLLRNINCKKIAAYIGGGIYIFSSAMVMWGSWPHTDVSCLGPLLFFLANRLLEEYKKKSPKIISFFLGVSVVLYFMLVGGMPAYALYFLYFGVIYEVYNMLAVHKFSWKQIAVCTVIFATAICLAGFMSFGYTGDVFFATKEYQEYRGGQGGYPMAIAHKKFLLTFLLPQLSTRGAQAIEYNVFSGIFVLFMIPAYFITKKDKNKTFWGVSILVLIIFIFFKYSGYIFKYIPLINTSRKTRIIILLNFGISILSALLISQLMTAAIKKWKSIIASIIWSMTVAGVIALAWNKSREVDALQTREMLICMAVALAAMINMVFRNRKKLSAMILLMTIFFSGAIFARNGLQMIDIDAGTIPEATESLEFLQERAGREYRMTTVGRANFIPNLNSYYNINNLCGHTLANTDEKLKKYLVNIDSKIYDTLTATSVKEIENWNLLMYGSIRYLLVEQKDLENIDLSQVNHDVFYFNDGECVVELKDTQPRAYIATEAEILETEADIIDLMMLDYRKDTIYTTENIDMDITATEDGSHSEVMEERNGAMTVNVSLDGSGYLVLADYCNNNWKVFVNGKEEHFIDCNYLFNAVYLDKEGDYTIEFIHHNKIKNMYWAVSLIAWGIVGVIILMRKKIAHIILKC